MRIAVISDTHDRLPTSVLSRLEEADEIWHLGDVCRHEILWQVEQVAKPVYHVRGNCDSDMSWPLTRTLKRDGLRFFLVHIPPAQAPVGCDVVLHGHTHVPRDETIQGVRFLNPGCITRPNRGAPASFAFLELEKGRIRWKTVLV